MAQAKSRVHSKRRSAKRGGRGPKYVYGFAAGRADGSSAMRDLLGGKGCELAEMTNLGIPVPPGFTITTEAWRAYVDAGKRAPAGLWPQVQAALARLEGAVGLRLGDPERPLLVSVRSGARVSMPGMMDTVLNLGLNDRTVDGLARWTRNERFAWDCYRRFLTIFGDVVLGIERHAFDRAPRRGQGSHRRPHRRRRAGPGPARARRRFKALIQEKTGARVSPGPRGAAAAGRPGRLRLVVREEGGGLPAHQPARRMTGAPRSP